MQTLIGREELGVRLHMLRWHRGWSARHVEELTGIPEASLLRWERAIGKRWLHDAERTAGLPRMWPHLLRHAFSHRVAANCGGDPEKWRIAMNHADLSQWSTYNTRTLSEVRTVMEAV